MWVRLFSLGEIVGGGTPKTDVKDYWNNGDIPWLTPADMKWVKGKYVSSGQRNITALALQSSSAQLMPPGSVIYSSRAPIGYIAIAENDLCTNQGFKSLVPISTQLSDYLYYALIAATPEIQSRASGTTFKEISGAEFGQTLVPLPPLAEQGNIVNKIERLLPEVETYNTKYNALSVLNEELPIKLKKSILQHAIQGKLVPQDPNDEPASVLLERIAEERAKLGKKAAKSMSRIERRDRGTYEIFPDGSEKEISGEVPFDIPDSWEWSRLSSVLQIARGGSPRPIKDYLTSDENGVNWIKIGDTTKGSKYIFTTREKIKPEGIAKSRLVNPGDFLLSNSMSFGRPYILKTSGCIHDGWLVLSGVELCFNVDFLFYLLSTPIAKSQFAESAAGAVVQNLNIAKVENAIFPIPPMEEQVRIQATISDLFADMPI